MSTILILPISNTFCPICYWTFVNIFWERKELHSLTPNLPEGQRSRSVHLPVGEKRERLGQLKFGIQCAEGRTNAKIDDAPWKTPPDGRVSTGVHSVKRQSPAGWTLPHRIISLYWASLQLIMMGDTRWPKDFNGFRESRCTIKWKTS